MTALLDQAAFEGDPVDPAAVTAAAEDVYESARSSDGTFDPARLADLFGGGPARELCFGRPSDAPYFAATVTVEERHRPRLAVVDVARSDADGRLQPTVRVDAFLSARLQWPQEYGRQPPSRAQGRLISYWTIARRADSGDWELVQVEPSYAGRYHERRRPSLDAFEPVRDTAITESGWTDRAFEGAIPLEIAGQLPADPHAALLDLAQIDGRFAPHVVEASVGQLLRAWSHASNRRSAGLEKLATPVAMRQLLDSGWAIRGARVERVKCLRVRPMRTPPEITVEVEMWSWYGPERPAEMIQSLNVPPRERTVYWRLSLDGTRACPWRLIDARSDPFSP